MSFFESVQKNPALELMLIWHILLHALGTYFNYERNFWAFFDPPSPLVRILTAIGLPPLGSMNAFSDPPLPDDHVVWVLILELFESFIECLFYVF